MYSVSRIPRPRHTQEPPRAMFDRLLKELERISPNHPALNTMFDTLAVDRLEDILNYEKHVRLAATEPSPE